MRLEIEVPSQMMKYSESQLQSESPELQDQIIVVVSICQANVQGDLTRWMLAPCRSRAKRGGCWRVSVAKDEHRKRKKIPNGDSSKKANISAVEHMLPQYRKLCYRLQHCTSYEGLKVAEK